MIKKEKYLVFPSVAFSAASRGCIEIQNWSLVNRSQNDSNLSWNVDALNTLASLSIFAEAVDFTPTTASYKTHNYIHK